MQTLPLSVIVRILNADPQPPTSESTPPLLILNSLLSIRRCSRALNVAVLVLFDGISCPLSRVCFRRPAALARLIRRASSARGWPYSNKLFYLEFSAIPTSDPRSRIVRFVAALRRLLGPALPFVKLSLSLSSPSLPSELEEEFLRWRVNGVYLDFKECQSRVWDRHTANPSCSLRLFQKAEELMFDNASSAALGAAIFGGSSALKCMALSNSALIIPRARPYLNSCGALPQSLEQLYLFSCDTVTDELIARVAMGCSRLRSLGVCFCDRVLAPPIASSSLADLCLVGDLSLDACLDGLNSPNLHSLRLSDCCSINLNAGVPQMDPFSLSVHGSFSHASLMRCPLAFEKFIAVTLCNNPFAASQSVSNPCANVDPWRLGCFMSVSALTLADLQLHDSELSRIVPALPSLAKLTIRKLPIRSPHLVSTTVTELTISSCCDVDDSMLRHLKMSRLGKISLIALNVRTLELQHCLTLRKVGVMACNRLQDDFFVSVPKSVTHLSLKAISSLREPLISRKSLQFLSVALCPNLDIRTFERLIQKCSLVCLDFVGTLADQHFPEFKRSNQHCKL